ncbi:hypothetical protein QBC33DRAFT_116863 [Phialemonium atrogriseum]|uniref:Uncharacterized protein n=1 Tax=Phialemonium atrogriseum TaxID=1093897 RepID=A0AAJ0BYQ7_9PEZI|nr:uncharacterized protein QBC33DRAFT_116863 [Phialemonium atrogriseum]KAK1766322.1 hypothetical protein QBC33DRAFT_116863 [Phialemonium atrogriseum]
MASTSGPTCIATQSVARDSLLTPVKRRRTRVSYSPVKTPKAVVLPARRKSMTLDNPVTPIQESILSNAALDFEEFSFWGPDGSLSTANISTEYNNALKRYLNHHYNVVEILYCDHFLVLGCEGELPPDDKRPFSIAGCIAIWKTEDEVRFDPHIGELGWGEPIQIDPAIRDKLHQHQAVPDEVLLYLANYVFPDCEAISMMWDGLVVELPKTSDEDFAKRIQTLPMDIERAAVHLTFHNGPLPNTPRRALAVKPKPARLDTLVADETDYVQADGKFYPGAMINSIAKNGQVYSSISAGVLVSKGQQQRLTCSFHNWEDHAKTYPGIFGGRDAESRRLFQVVQGMVNGNPGTPVGIVTERVGDTDIALAQLDNGIVFENTFMETNAIAKTLVHSKFQSMRDVYVIDSFVTGQQFLKGFGQRAVFERRAGRPHPHLYSPAGAEHLAPPHTVAYIRAKQGVFTTNAPVMTKEPHIRDSVCGTVLLRCKDGKRQKDTQKQVLERGEVCAMMHFADLQSKTAKKANDFLIYADAFDPLIDAGWEIVPPAERENQGEAKNDAEEAKEEEEAAKEEEEEEEEEAEFSLEESPTKRRRVL